VVPCGWPKAKSRSRRSAGGESSTLSAGTTMRFGRTALLLNRVDEARHHGIAAHRFDEIVEANYRKALALAEPRYAPARHIAAWVLASSSDAPASGSPRALGHRHHDVSLDRNELFGCSRQRWRVMNWGGSLGAQNHFSMGKAPTISGFRHLSCCGWNGRAHLLAHFPPRCPSKVPVWIREPKLGVLCCARSYYRAYGRRPRYRRRSYTQADMSYALYAPWMSPELTAGIR